jgi:hypothetical protein
MRPKRKQQSTPPLWLGCDACSWARLLARNRVAIHRSRWHLAALVSAVSICHTALRCVQQALYGQRVASTPIRNAPIFILGHWRSGTTLLHELLGRDPRHACPTTYECFTPHHFLLSRSWLPKLLTWLLPSRRPMDNMAAGWDRPQEDEFALCLLGQPSPYERLAFPNRPAKDNALLDLDTLSPSAQRRWQTVFRGFVEELSIGHDGRRLVLKSPPHTCRIPTLLKMFPDARFVHIIRDPYDIYPSTLHLWRVLYGIHALQRPSWIGLEQHIFGTFTHLYDRLEQGKRLIRPGRFHELRYEDLVRDPIGILEALYHALVLDDFEQARPHVEIHLAELKDYRPNPYVLTPAEQHTITRVWGDVIRRYGYAIRSD